MVIRRRIDEVEENFGRLGWQEELDKFYRQRRSVVFVLALMIAMNAFWTSRWTFVVFFGVMAVYSLLCGVRIGFICGLSFAFWFTASIEGWVKMNSWQSQVCALWSIATLMLLVVWKKDDVERLKLKRRQEE